MEEQLPSLRPLGEAPSLDSTAFERSLGLGAARLREKTTLYSGAPLKEAGSFGAGGRG